MANFVNAERDAADLAKLVNEDVEVTTRYGDNPKKSYQRVIKEIQDSADNKINSLADNYNLTPAFDFANGFTIETRNQAGKDADGNYWIYNGALPFEVTAGTVPSEPDYKQVTFSEAQNVTLSTGQSVQGFADSFALKIFQSPTNGGLTEIQTRTVASGEVYEVRKTSDDSLATIYSDAAGTTEIVQNGTNNKSGSDGVVEFYIADGDYYIEVDGIESGFTSLVKASNVVFDDNSSAQDYKDSKELAVSSRRFIGTAGDDSGSPDGVFVVNRTHGLESSPHSFKDNTVWYPPLGEYAMASYDAYARIYDENITDHFIDYQSRGRKYGSAICKQMWGFASIQRVDLGHVNKYTGFENSSSIYTDATCTTYTSFQSQPIIHGEADTVTHFQVRATTGIGSPGAEFGYYCKSLSAAPPDSTYPILIDAQPEGVVNLIQCPTESVGAITQKNTGTSVTASFDVTSAGGSFSRNYNAKSGTRREVGVVNEVLIQDDGFLFRGAPTLGKGTPATMVNAVKIFSSGDVELFNGGAIIASSPDGTRYKLTPPNSGGSATWEAV